MSEGKKKKAPAKARPVQQLKYNGAPYQMVDPRNGSVAVIFHRGAPLPKEKNKEVELKHLCFHRVVTSRGLWMPDGADQKKEVAAAGKAKYVRTLRTVDADKKSIYRPLTKAQMRKLYGKEVTRQTIKLSGGIDIPLYDYVVKAFVEEETSGGAKKKRKASGSESKDEKRARLMAALAKLDADDE